MKTRALQIAVGIVLAGAPPALIWAGPQEEAAMNGAAALAQSQGQIQEDLAQARQKLEYDRLMRLLYNLEVLQGKIQIAGINATLSRPQGFVAQTTRKGCGFEGMGLCFAPVIEFRNVSAYHLSDLLKYHRQTLSALEEANAAAQSALGTLKTEAANTAYSPEVRKTLQELASDMESTDGLRNTATQYYSSLHEYYAASFAGTPTTSGDVSLSDPKGYAEVMGNTAGVLRYQLDVVGKAADRIRQYRAPNGAVLVSDRSALDAALEDPRNVVMLIFGKPGSRAAEVHDKALNLTEPWEKAFLVTDASILTPEEKKSWYQGEGSFVTLNLAVDFDSLSPEEKKGWREGNYAQFNAAHASVRKRWISDFDLPGLMPPSNRLILSAWAKAGCGDKCPDK